jgi:chromatin assembly factor 1 subunit A
MTFKPFALGKANMSQLARKPTGRRLPLDYDYDSEAEWQEEEEGEDLDVDDDEEEMDDEDDMDGFLDDSEDAGLSRRLFANTLEPNSTGICFEDGNQLANKVVYEHRMEFIHGKCD